jgi:hypothetical protein
VSTVRQILKIASRKPLIRATDGGYEIVGLERVIVFNIDAQS